MLKTISQKTEDLKLALINEEIDNALELYPDEPYKKVFAIPELRQKLIDYVTKGIQEVYPVIQTTQNLPVKTKFPYRSLELRLHIENYVHWGIEYILEVNSNRVTHSPKKLSQSIPLPTALAKVSPKQ
jgi:hypothetical protein